MNVFYAIGIALLSFSPGHGASQCKTNPRIVAACYTVHGRARFGAGTPTLRIWRIGTKRMLGVTAGPRADDADAPIFPKEMLIDPEEELFGDFEVCPFTPERKGEMQMVCVESASHLLKRVSQSGESSQVPPGQSLGVVGDSPSPPTMAPNRLQIPSSVAQGLLCRSANRSSQKRSHHSNSTADFCGTISQPVYPPEAKRQGIQGTVNLRAFIGQDGLVKEVRVIDGSPMLTAAAIEAVKGWKYRPYLLNGKPVGFETSIAVNFELAKSK